MRTLALALILLVQDVDIKPRLLAGDTFRLEVTRVRENSQRPQGDGSSRTPVEVRVISASPQGFELDWVPGATVFDNPAVAKDPMVTAAARAVEQIQFRITLNEDGEFTGLANHDQVSQQLQTMAGVMIKQLLGTAPAAQRAQIESLMGQVLTPELLISSATRDVQIYFGLNGASLAPGETLEVPLDQPSPFGGGTLAATYRVHMESSAAEFASVSTTMNYDAEGLRRMTAALMKQVGANIPPAELEAMPPIQLTDDGKYSYDRTFGIMREAAVTRRISSGPMRRLDGWTIRMISAPKR